MEAWSSTISPPTLFCASGLRLFGALIVQSGHGILLYFLQATDDDFQVALKIVLLVYKIGRMEFRLLYVAERN